VIDFVGEIHHAPVVGTLAIWWHEQDAQGARCVADLDSPPEAPAQVGFHVPCRIQPAGPKRFVVHLAYAELSVWLRIAKDRTWIMDATDADIQWLRGTPHR
jgi:hypothetical protein